MDYPISFNNNRVYSVPDTRFTKYGFALQRPAAMIQPSSPITPVNMLPYQVATPGVPYGYTLVPQQMIAPGQRLVPLPAGRNVYSVLDYDDEEEEYVPPRRPRSRLLDLETESPEMEEFSAATRQIRKDADSILQRLGTSKPKSRASDLFRNYDYDTRPLTSRYLAPPPDRSHLRNASPSLDDEPDPVLQALRPAGRRYGSLNSRPSTSTYGTERVFTPSSLTANRIQSLYKELDEPLYAPEIKSFDYTECLRRDRKAAGEKVRGDVQCRAALLDTSPSLAEARERRTSVKRDRLGYDPNSVKSNISIRAQYAAMRAAASRNIRTPTTHLTIAPTSSISKPITATSSSAHTHSSVKLIAPAPGKSSAAPAPAKPSAPEPAKTSAPAPPPPPPEPASNPAPSATSAEST